MATGKTAPAFEERLKLSSVRGLWKVLGTWAPRREIWKYSCVQLKGDLAVTDDDPLPGVGSYHLSKFKITAIHGLP